MTPPIQRAPVQTPLATPAEIPMAKPVEIKPSAFLGDYCLKSSLSNRLSQEKADPQETLEETACYSWLNHPLVDWLFNKLYKIFGLPWGPGG